MISSSSALPFIASMLLRPRVRIMCFRKFTFFSIASSRVTFNSGITIFNGMPGNPPPEPMSRRLDTLLSFKNLATVRESRKCFTVISLSERRLVKFIFSFHFLSSSRYIKKARSSLSRISILSSFAPALNMSDTSIRPIAILLVMPYLSKKVIP